MDKKYYTEERECQKTERPMRPERPDHPDYAPRCGAEVISARTLTECSGENIYPCGIKGPVTVKVPVVIAEKRVQIDVEANIELEDPAYEIKRIKKDVYLTQCKLIPKAGLVEHGKPMSGKVFLAGFIRKNIEYATVECVGNKVVSGDIKHTTVDVPFECITTVEYATPPIINSRGITREVELICDDGHCKCGEEFIGKFACEQDFEDAIAYTEKPYCELEAVRIFEEDLHRGFNPVDPRHPHVKTFKKITEKMVVYIQFKVLQLQQVSIGHEI